MSQPTRIIINVDPAFVPVDGDAFAAVLAALEHFEIPCTLERIEDAP